MVRLELHTRRHLKVFPKNDVATTRSNLSVNESDDSRLQKKKIVNKKDETVCVHQCVAYQILLQSSPLAYFGYILCPFCTMEYKSERSLFYILMCSEWHNTLFLCVSHTHIYKPEFSSFILHCTKTNKNEGEISRWRLLLLMI